MTNPAPPTFPPFEVFTSPDSFILNSSGEKHYIWEHLWPTRPTPEQQEQAQKAMYERSNALWANRPKVLGLPRGSPGPEWFRVYTGKPDGSYTWETFWARTSEYRDWTCYPTPVEFAEWAAWEAEKREAKRLERVNGVSFWEPWLQRTFMGMGCPFVQKVREKGLICEGEGHVVRSSFVKGCVFNPANASESSAQNS
ncbi:hypothetical protein BJ508DRAFT_303868 [Ascobolus immersus RN42]|uniref:Uncharacterized protein n=1 Tax=Ascobolus immersus RN42 TaxID=1160509 RepID=A0A3N4IE36_ASCIM|nr:hypothetical protein BJ508DRAFT_303868 [Ascobolus immersus RN42]